MAGKEPAMTTEPQPTPIVCANCGAQVRIKIARPGLKFKCPRCNALLDTGPARNSGGTQIHAPTGFSPTPVDNSAQSESADDEIRVAPVHQRVEQTAHAAATLLKANEELTQPFEPEVPVLPLVVGVLWFPFYLLTLGY